MKKLVIIGGGVAGLTAGIFAQKNGYESIILEKNDIMGGFCTGWDRKGYYVDGCIHWLVGTREGTDMNLLWKFTGALEGVEIYHPESFIRFDYKGDEVNFYQDLDRLKESWIELAPQDKEAIEEFCNTLLIVRNFDIGAKKPMDLMTLKEKIKMIYKMKNALPILGKYEKMSQQDYAKKFTHPALRAAIESFLPEGYSALSVLFSLAFFTNKDASLPYGGSRAFALRMEEKYLSLGGKIQKNCEIEKVIKEKNLIKKVISKKADEYEGDCFIFACDPKQVFDKFLKGEHNDKAYETRYNDSEVYPLASEIQIAIGCEDKLENIPRTVSFEVQNIKVFNRRLDFLGLTHYAHEKEYAPEGKIIMIVAINQFSEDIEKWYTLYEDKKSYNAAKKQIAEEVIKEIEIKFPTLKGKMSIVDIATPKTFARYCNGYKGAYMSFIPTTKSKRLSHKGKIKGIKNAVLTGQWLQPPGGLPVALVTGKDTIMRLCKKDKKEFAF